MKRRRFISLVAAFACAPALARADTWSGYALGADVSVTLHGPRDMTRLALAEVPRLLESIEDAFSLYRPSSDITRLNADGRLSDPKPLFHELMVQADKAHDLSGGIFDPSVQPLWAAAAQDGDLHLARQAIGWKRVRFSDRMINMDRGQAVTFNGIAQGFATDAMRHLLRRHGVTKALVNIGEHAAMGGPFTLGLDDPVHGHLGTRHLHDMAIATSSPAAMIVGGQHHIFGPHGQAPLWSTVSIEAESATLADALSTAAVFMDRETVAQLKQVAKLHRVTLVDRDGNIQTV